MQNQGNKVLSAAMLDSADRYWLRLCDSWPEAKTALPPSQQQELKVVFGLSDYIAEQLCRHPEWIVQLFDGLLDDVVRSDFDAQLHSLLVELTQEEQVKSALRCYRNLLMVALARLDFLNYDPAEESLPPSTPPQP